MDFQLLFYVVLTVWELAQMAISVTTHRGAVWGRSTRGSLSMVGLATGLSVEGQ